MHARSHIRRLCLTLRCWGRAACGLSGRPGGAGAQRPAKYRYTPIHTSVLNEDLDPNINYLFDPSRFLLGDGEEERLRNIALNHHRYEGHLLLQRNDPALAGFSVGWERAIDDEYAIDFLMGGPIRRGTFLPHSNDWKKLGECIGKHETLESLGVGDLPNFVPQANVDRLWEGIAQNRSLCELRVSNGALLEANNIRTLTVDGFFHGDSLTLLTLDGCIATPDAADSLAKALSNFYSLEEFSFQGNGVRDDHLPSIVEALAVHPDLWQLTLAGTRAGVKTCKAVAALCQSPNCNVTDIAMYRCGITDEGVKELANGLEKESTLKTLSVWGNRAITANGWRSMPLALSRNKDSRLEQLVICNSSIDEEMLRLVCDTTTVNATYQSNHALREFDTLQEFNGRRRQPRELYAALKLNSEGMGKHQIAVNKILKFHDVLDLSGLFEWGLKPLPVVVAWLDKVKRWPRDFDPNIERKKLMAIYQLLHAAPLSN